MLLWMIERMASTANGTGVTPPFLTARIGLAAVVSFLATLLLGPRSIRWLKSHFAERIDSASERLNQLHAAKAGTPTMGGMFVSSAIVLSVLLFGNLTNSRVQLALFVTITFTLLGCMDDWIKLTTKKRASPRGKSCSARSCSRGSRPIA